MSMRSESSGWVTLFAACVYGTLAAESEQVLSRLTGMLTKRKEERGVSENCACIKIQAAIVKATSLCLRARCFVNQPYAAAGEWEGAEDEASQQEDAEVAEDLAGQWAALRVRVAGSVA